MSLLNKLKDKAGSTTTTTASKDKRTTYVLDSKFFSDHGFDNPEELQNKSNEDMQKLAELDASVKTLTGQMDLLKSRLNGYAKSAFLDAYNDNGRQPENFKIHSADGKSTALFISQDKYTGKDFDTIREICPDIVEDGMEVTVNLELMEKYDKALTKFFQTSKEIADEDRDNFFAVKPQVRVKKGTIENLAVYAKKAKLTIEALFDLVKPVHYVSKFTSKK
jgi:hypothetical protein